MINGTNSPSAIIDWECVSTKPFRAVTEMPKFLQGPTWDEEPQRDKYGNEAVQDMVEKRDGNLANEGKAGIYWEHLMEYEQTQLRKVYAEAMSRQSPR
ncbi:hypothetical protein BFJ70_g857 [Fusarium oxysporum]|nr:hypothetical protein NW765_006524 [Fusarium oxysporum]RKL52144.1 hypothetical protein BFJ70_g857 [Fusarium oxysporum]